MLNKREKKLIIFDLDGTLVHFPFDYLYSETHRIFNDQNWGPLEQAIIEDCFADFDYFRFARETLHLDPQLLIDEFWKHFNWDLYPKAELFSGAENILENLCVADYDLAIATARGTKREKLITELLAIGVDKFFSAVHCREDLEQDWKDKSPQISRILKDLNVHSSLAILIGDTPSDIESAKQAGLFGSVAVLSGGIKKHVLEKSGADFVIEEISLLPTVLKEWGF